MLPGNATTPNFHHRQLLGMLLKAPQQLHDADILAPEDLHRPDDRITLEVLRDLALARNGLTEAHHPVLIAMVAARLRRPEYEIAVMFNPLIEGCYSTANLVDFAAKVKRAALDRKIDDAMKGGDYRKVHDLVAEQDRIKERLKKPVAESGFVWVQDFCALPPKQSWLVRGYLEPDTLCVLFGDSQAYKSFLAIDWACHLATRKEWRGCKVKPGIVLYVAGEGGNGLSKRFRAWFEYHQEPMRNVAISTVPLALCDPANVAELIARIKVLMAAMPGTPVFIVLDTLNTHFGDGDENSTADMRKFLNGIRQLRIATGAAILVVHHVGHADKGRGRGSISLHQGVDWEYRLERSPESQTTTLINTKPKDAEKPAPLSWSLEVVPLPWADEDGQPLHSAVLVPHDFIPAARPVKEKIGHQQRRALELLQELYRTHRKNLEDDDRDPNTARVTIADWQNAMQDISDNRARRSAIRSELLNSGYIKVENGFVYPTSSAS